MALTNAELWARIKAFEFPDIGGQTIEARVNREFKWSKDKGAVVLSEFRRFIYFCVIEDQPLVPSAEIYALWRELAFIYGDRWAAICEELCGSPLKHDIIPDPDLQWRIYEKTRQIFEREFGYPPTSEAWSKTAPRTVVILRGVLASSIALGMLLLIFALYADVENAAPYWVVAAFALMGPYGWMLIDDTWARVRGLGLSGAGCGSGSAIAV